MGQFKSMLNLERTVGLPRNRGNWANNRVSILSGCHKVVCDCTQSYPCHEIVSMLLISV